MDGIHDLGGMQGFGPVGHVPAEPPFGEEWEGRVHGMMIGLAISGQLAGQFRYAIERMDPVHYLTSPYYEHWLEAIDRLLVDAGTLSRDEIDRAVASARAGSTVPARSVPEHAQVVRALFRPGPRRPTSDAAVFATGQRVRVRDVQTSGHTRCPRYVRGRSGAIARQYGSSPLPDGGADGARIVEPYYAVAFDAAELWGSEAEPRSVVCVDLWQSYLEEA